jgi:hypothetical protein
MSADDHVKLLHARDLVGWDGFPAYEEHRGKTLAQYRAEVKAREDLRRRIWKLIETRRLVDCADDPKVYRTETPRTPWPISLPGRRSVRLSPVTYPETIIGPDLGRVERGRLVVPLWMKQCQITVRYLAPDRVTLTERVRQAKTDLAGAPKADLEALQTYLSLQEPDPLVFVSHRWTSRIHPDPDGRQLEKLKALKNCYLIYDYTSFPQDTSTPEMATALSQVLDAMNEYIDNLLVLSDPDYMDRGWCLYEYIVGSLTHRIVCDEIKDPVLVRLRNLVATDPNPLGVGSTYREAVNAKSQFVLEAVNAVLPAFGKGRFTVPTDKALVRNLLIERLGHVLPRKQEYMQYVGEWKTIEWTKQELMEAFEGELKWEALQYDPTIPIFEPLVPDTVAGAVAAGFAIQHQPKHFFRSGLDRLDFSGLDRIVLTIRIGAGVVILLLLWALYRAFRWALGF